MTTDHNKNSLNETQQADFSIITNEGETIKLFLHIEDKEHYSAALQSFLKGTHTAKNKLTEYCPNADIEPAAGHYIVHYRGLAFDTREQHLSIPGRTIAFVLHV